MQKKKGFTLIELVMVLVIMSVISLVLGKSLYQAFQTFQTAEQASEADWSGFIAMQRMVSDIHTIRSAASITTISASNFVFTDVSGNSVQYQLSSGNLLRNTQTVTNGITALAFTYYDKNGSVTATASSVRYILISLTATEGTLSLPFVTLAATRVLP